MINRYADGERAAALLERRWFAALRMQPYDPAPPAVMSAA